MKKNRLATQQAGAKVATAMLVLAAASAAMSSCTSRSILEESKNVTGTIKSQVVDHGSKEMKIWLVQPKGQDLNLVSVTRSKGMKDDLKEAVEELLKGPTPEEARDGLASEIPKGVILISVKSEPDGIVLNLSRRFALDDGGASIETRVEQLKRTVSDLSDGKKVYLDVEGERLTTASGEGLEIKQPIN